MNPRVSVVMGVHRAERHVREAIQSILNQSFKDFEFIIILDGSNNETKEIVKSFSDSRIIVAENPTNIGLTKTLNIGLKLSRGEYVARQDADDISHPNRFKFEVEYLDSHSEIAAVGSTANVINVDGEFTSFSNRPTDPATIRWNLMFGNCLYHSSVMFRRRLILDEFGGYDENFLRTQDYDLWVRLAQRYLIANLKTPLLLSRHHSGSISHNRASEGVRYTLQIMDRQLSALGVSQEWKNLWRLFALPYSSDQRDNYLKLLDVVPRIYEMHRQKFGLSGPTSRWAGLLAPMRKLIELSAPFDRSLAIRLILQMGQRRPDQCLRYLKPKFIWTLMNQGEQAK